MTLYLLHRYIGLAKVNAANSIDSRYQSISKVVPYYPYLGVLFGSLSVYFLMQTGLQILPVLICPLLLSLLYVIPFLPQGKRLRDISIIKIFLIALTWTWFSTWYLVGQINGGLITLIIIEHFIFMIGITLPFDIRDMKIDTRDGVSTLATLLGKQNTLKLTSFLLLVSLVFTLIILTQIASITLAYFFYTILYFSLLLLININISYDRDVYLTGVLDGVILLKGLIGWLYLV